VFLGLQFSFSSVSTSPKSYRFLPIEYIIFPSGICTRLEHVLYINISQTFLFLSSNYSPLSSRYMNHFRNDTCPHFSNCQLNQRFPDPCSVCCAFDKFLTVSTHCVHNTVRINSRISNLYQIAMKVNS